MTTIKISKSQWEFIGKKAGWMKKATILGPGFVEDYGSQTWKEKFGKPVTTSLIIDDRPLIMTPKIGDDEVVVMVEHNGEHIGVYAPNKGGFTCTYTRHLDKYEPYKKRIDTIAKDIANTI